MQGCQWLPGPLSPFAGSVGRSSLENVRETRRPFLQCQLNAVRSEADCVVPAAQHQQVKDLGFSQFLG